MVLVSFICRRGGCADMSVPYRVFYQKMTPRTRIGTQSEPPLCVAVATTVMSCLVPGWPCVCRGTPQTSYRYPPSPPPPPPSPLGSHSLQTATILVASWFSQSPSTACAYKSDEHEDEFLRPNTHLSASNATGLRRCRAHSEDPVTRSGKFRAS